MRGKLKKAGWDDRFLLKLVSSAASLAEDAEPEKNPDATALNLAGRSEVW